MALETIRPPKQVRKKDQRIVACRVPSLGVVGTAARVLKVLGEKCCREACCLPIGTCEDLTPEDCANAGGVSQGANTSCTDPDIDCDIPQACCFADGSCVDVPPNECVKLGGVPQGKGTECVNVECLIPEEPQACCLPDGSCADLTPAECAAQGGISQGKGTACADPDIDCDDGAPGPCPTGTGCTETCPQTIAVEISGGYTFCSNQLLHHGPPCDSGCMTNEYATVIPGHRAFQCGWSPNFFQSFPTCFGHDRFVYGSIFCFSGGCDGLPCWKVELGILIHHADSDSITASAKWFFEKPTTTPEQCMLGDYTLVGTEGFAPLGSTIQVLAGSLSIT